MGSSEGGSKGALADVASARKVIAYSDLAVQAKAISFFAFRPALLLPATQDLR
jgi:hypothetical protein